MPPLATIDDGQTFVGNAGCSHFTGRLHEVVETLSALHDDILRFEADFGIKVSSIGLMLEEARKKLDICTKCRASLRIMDNHISGLCGLVYQQKVALS